VYAGLALTLALATARVTAGELSAGDLVAVNAYRTCAQLHLFPPMLEKRPMSSPPPLLFPPPELPTPSVTPWVTLPASTLQRNPGGVLRIPPRAAPACRYCTGSASIKHAPPRTVAALGAAPAHISCFFLVGVLLSRCPQRLRMCSVTGTAGLGGHAHLHGSTLARRPTQCWSWRIAMPAQPLHSSSQPMVVICHTTFTFSNWTTT